jgi:CRP-like cAMP-binding protein
MKKFLRQITIFSELNDEELEFLERVASQREYPKDSYIVREDDPGISLFIIRSGAVDVVFEESTEKSIHLSTLRSYEFFGEISLFDGKPRSATVIAREHSTIVEITRDILLTKISKHPDIGLKILAKMSQRIRNLDDIVKQFSDQIYGQVSQKVEDKLAAQLDFVEKLYKKTEERASNTLVGVEESWKRLWRLITIVVGVFTVFASVVGFFGYKNYDEIKETLKRVKETEERVKESKINIEGVEKYASEASILREVMLNIHKTRNDLKIDLFNIKDYLLPNDELKLSKDELKNLAINFSLSKEELFNNYINRCEELEPEVCLEAALTMIELQKINNQKQIRDQLLKREDSDKLFSALIEVIKKSPERNWRMQLRARDELIKLTKKINNLNEITNQLISLVHDNLLKDYVKFNFALLLAELNIIDDDAKEVFNRHMNNSPDKWIRSLAAIGLMQMGDENIFSNISDIIYKNDSESFPTALLLGELGKKRLLSLPAIKTLENNSKKDFINFIKKIIIERKGNDYENRFMEEYCENLIRNLN